MKFLEVMLTILGIIGTVLVVLSVWFATVIGIEDTQDITFKFNILTFLTGLAYILFILIVTKLIKK